MYTIYLRGDLLYLVSALKVISAISVVLFKYLFCPFAKFTKISRNLLVIVNCCQFYNIRFSVLCEGFFPRITHFFFSSANAHALSSRRSRWRDAVPRKERHCRVPTVLFSNYKHSYRREYRVNL